MYYRKYFAGTTESYSAYESILNIAVNRNFNRYVYQTEVLCEAIKSTLEGAGITCTYNPETNIFNIGGLSVQIYVYNQNGNIGFYANGKTIYENSATGGNPFSGLNYKFYVTLKGDVDSVLDICVGRFQQPADETYGISIGAGTDLKDGSQVYLVGSCANARAAQFYIIKEDKIFTDFQSLISFGGEITYAASLGNDITLIECIAQPGRFKLNNCYFGNQLLGELEFYNIGGEIYYKRSKNILVKCISRQES